MGVGRWVEGLDDTASRAPFILVVPYRGVIDYPLCPRRTESKVEDYTLDAEVAYRTAAIGLIQ